MDKNQTSQGTHARVLSTANRQPLGARVLLVLLFLALSLASLQPRASAQGAADQRMPATSSSVTSLHQRALAPSCPECQQAYQDCLGNGGSNCNAAYIACMASCQ
jgi:hypothetical protein